MLSLGTHHVALIVPALNEESAIGLVLNDIPPGVVEQLIVVDNGSKDRTAEVAAGSGAQVIREPERGYGSACLAGIKALSPQIDVVAFMDGDYSDFPSDLSAILRPILDGDADFVLGSRTHNSNSHKTLTFLQRWGNRLATSLMRCFWGCAYSDLGPLRAIRRESLALLSMADRNFGWTIEMQIKTKLFGLRIREIPVSYRPRVGTSKVSRSFKGAILAGTKILFTILLYAYRTKLGERYTRRKSCGC